MAKQRLKAEDRLARFIDDAASLIHEHGLEALTMENLAARSGVNKALPYRFFANRDEVLVALFEAENLAFDELLNQHRKGAETFRDEISALVQTWVTAMGKKMGTPSLQTARTATGKLEEERLKRWRGSRDFIQGLIESHYKMPSHRARMCAEVLFAGSQGFAASIDKRKIKQTDLVETYINMIVGGVEATLAQD